MSKNQRHLRCAAILNSGISSFFQTQNGRYCFFLFFPGNLRLGDLPLSTFLSPRALNVVGVTGFEPVTLRLSSACSNQLSYRPPGRLGCSSKDLTGGGMGIRTPDL